MRIIRRLRPCLLSWDTNKSVRGNVMQRLLAFFVVVVLVLLGAAVVIGVDRQGALQPAGEVTVADNNPAQLYAQKHKQRAAANNVGAPEDKQILFGDVHAHTTFSMDAFAWSIPLLGGEGIHPPADACDYARYVADLDFWALTDHAESQTPRHWQLTKDSVRACNAAAGDPDNPDLVTFLGWEWTQIGQTRETHYGHRNVFLLDYEEGKIPTRPIAASGTAFKAMRNDSLNPFEKYIGPYLVDFKNRQRQFDQQHKQDELRRWPVCEGGIPVRELPNDCIETAATPEGLFTKLADWGFPVMAVPHGTSWGFYTPPGYSFDKQVTPRQHDRRRQRLIEVFSGHGSAEEYRNWRAVTLDVNGNPVCPEPSENYLPSCHRAGEIIRARCDDPQSAQCEQRVNEAEQNHLAALIGGHISVPGVTPEDWLDAGQCRDCFMPPLNHRPGGSVQYILAKRNFDEQDASGDPFGLRFGFIGSSDNHNARPGNGFKEKDRTVVTDTFGAQNSLTQSQFIDAAKPDAAKSDTKRRWSQPFDRATSPYNFLQITEAERQASFFYTGGLVAVHSAGRDRRAIWDAMQRREVYATSGSRQLLWFDLLNGQDGETPMGSITAVANTPRFRVRAVGAFEQKPGCPPKAAKALGAERLQYISGGECYNPSDTRIPIERIEVIRIRPQITAEEPIADLIEDPWKVHECNDTGIGCAFEFDDPEFSEAGREFIYYVRALQAPTPIINADGLRCETDEQGQCLAVNPCYGDLRTPADDDCTAPASERAWSSPIYLRPAG